MQYPTNKEDVYRAQLTIGGNRLDYSVNAASLTTSLLETKNTNQQHHKRCKIRAKMPHTRSTRALRAKQPQQPTVHETTQQIFLREYKNKIQH